MAINLWKLGGKPTSYNPLPTGWNNLVLLGLGTYVVTFKAMSPSGASLKVSDVGNEDIAQTIVLTNVLTSYSYTFKSTTYNQNFYFTDLNAKGDIIITDIQLVEKSLPKLTINGVDGFKSSQFTLFAPQGTVVNDETLVLNTTANGQPAGYYLVDVIPNTNYTVQCDTPTGKVGIYKGDASASINGYGLPVPKTFNTGDQTQIRVYFSNDLSGAGTFTFKRPMLNLGTIPVPYEKKRGGMMVMPVAKGNGTYQINDIPRKYVGKKNLLSDTWKQGNTSGASLTTRISDDFVELQQKSYTFSLNSGYAVWLDYFDQSKALVTSVPSYQTGSYTFTPTSNVKYLKATIKRVDDGNILVSDIPLIKPQLEEGITSTIYEPYTQVLPRAKKGLSFNGLTDYFQLPSMTMDSVEIDCLIDSVQPNSTYYLFDARSGVNSYVYNQVTFPPDAISSMIVDGVSKGSFNLTQILRNQRTKIKTNFSAPITDNVTIFSKSSALEQTKGTLYKVTCYLAGNIVAQYDFEKTGNVVGDKVLQNAKNLIPSFEDSRWSLHANTQVLGKDYLRLNASVGALHPNAIVIPCIPNTNYLTSSLTNGKSGIVSLVEGIQTSTTIVNYNGTNSYTFNTGNNTTLRFTLSNSGAIGTFDFIKPQLYQLDGKEGTINGAPTVGVKQTRRVQYAKR